MSALAQAWLLFRLESRLAARNFVGRLSREKSGWRAVPLVAIFVVAITPTLVMVGSGGVGLYLALRANGQPDGALALAFAAGAAMALVFGFFYVMSAFFYARDLRILLPMPLSPAAIVGGKFLRLVVGEYLTVAFVVVPVTLAYGVGSGTLAYWPLAALVFLLLPVAPLAVDGVLVLALMRLTAGRGMKPPRDLLRVALALGVMAAAIGLQLFVKSHLAHSMAGVTPKIQHAHSADELMRSLPFPPHLVERVAAFVPTAAWATRGLAHPASASGAFSMLLYVVVSLGAGALVMLVAGRTWLASVSLDEGGARRAKSALRLSDADVRPRTPFAALVWREWTLVVRSPILLLNAVVPVLVFVILGISALTGTNGLGGLREQLAHGGFLLSLAPVFGAAATGLFVSMGTLGSTAISREGRRFWLSCALPVDASLQLFAKLSLGVVQGLVGLALVLFAMAAVGLPPTDLARAAVLAPPMMALVLCALVAIDLWRPYLTWTDPQQALNGNINALLGLALAMAVLATTVGLGALVAFLAPRLMLPVLLALLVVAALVALRGVVALARFRYREAPI